MHARHARSTSKPLRPGCCGRPCAGAGRLQHYAPALQRMLTTSDPAFGSLMASAPTLSPADGASGAGE